MQNTRIRRRNGLGACLLALGLIIGLSPAGRVMAEPITDDASSSAQVEFAPLAQEFTLEAQTPGLADSDALNIEFAGNLPLFAEDAYTYADVAGNAGDRWLKITDTHPLIGWEVTASLSDFTTEDDTATAIFGARITWEDAVSYRQTGTTVDADLLTGLTDSTSGSWLPATLASDIKLISGEGATPITENGTEAKLNLGYFYVLFPEDGITMDNIVPADGQVIRGEVPYIATITWTGSGTPVN